MSISRRPLHLICHASDDGPTQLLGVSVGQCAECNQVAYSVLSIRTSCVEHVASRDLVKLCKGLRQDGSKTI